MGAWPGLVCHDWCVGGSKGGLCVCKLLQGMGCKWPAAAPSPPVTGWTDHIWAGRGRLGLGCGWKLVFSLHFCLEEAQQKLLHFSCLRGMLVMIFLNSRFSFPLCIYNSIHSLSLYLFFLFLNLYVYFKLVLCSHCTMSGNTRGISI